MADIKPFDIMCTATLRPELIQRTFDSFIQHLFKDDIKKARLILNVDMVGSENKGLAFVQIMRYVEQLGFSDIVMRTEEHKPNFSLAFYWCLGQLKNQLIFNLEEDWEMLSPMDFHEMVSLFKEESTLAHLRLSAFPSEHNGNTAMKVWNRQVKWNGKYFEVPAELRGTIGWAGHPSLNRASFLMYFGSCYQHGKNPEIQIKGGHPIIQRSKFGVFHKLRTPAVIKDIGRQWMSDHGYRKKGENAIFTEWEKIPQEVTA